ncbi:complex I subunit 5 family protein [Gracilinema caldarium]|uniref:NADH dehydrogenase (Quinone) n=1 Tax=Gracilinema caldarium (strain ATCC 51460 / DSM 7334 / H1) TaxID=744872 RepID=F8F1H2_GRAC1|nr:proton-conducting transporter membrane subunit [Gracilinema caldarium]AEJ19025.1 NADH dehydrogenase (quinone) [Gracilinema caldarium DSM 7334]
MRAENLVLAQILLPLAGAALCFSSKLMQHRLLRQWVESFAGFVGLFIPIGLLVWLYPIVRDGPVRFFVGNQHPLIGIELSFDGMSWLLNGMGFISAGSAWLYSRTAGPHAPEFSALFFIQTFALTATASSSDLFNLFVCFEILGIASYALTAFSEKGRAYLAAFSYMAVSSTAMAIFLLGVFGFYRITGSLSYDGILQHITRITTESEILSIGLSLVCIVVATAVRVAILPVYGWLPEAHASAPHAISAVLSGVLIKVPLFALGRFLFLLMSHMSAIDVIFKEILDVLKVSGTLTALVAVIFALAQKEAKRLLAYHSISQIGYVVSAWALGSPLTIAAAWMHAFYHALFKGLLFLSVGSITDAASSKNVYAIRRAYKTGFIPTISFFVGALSISAFPPFNGFASKAAISYLHKGSWEYIVLSLASAGTVASMIKLSRIFWPIGQKENTSGTSFTQPNYVQGFWLKTSLVFFSVACLITGLFAPQIGAVAGSLAGTAKNPVPASLFSFSALQGTLLLLGQGVLVYLGITSPLGKHITHVLEVRRPSFAGLLFAFSLSLGMLGGLVLLRH